MRNLFLYLAIVCAFSCNTNPFGISTGADDAAAGSADGKIRFSFGLRNFREITITMHSKVGLVDKSANTSSSEQHNKHGREGMSEGMSKDMNEGESIGNKESGNVSIAANVAETTCAPKKAKRKGEESIGWHGSYTNKSEVGKVWCSGVKDLLPKSNALTGLTGPTQVGIFKLASVYCQQLMQDTDAGKQARTRRLPTVASQLNALTMAKRPADIDSALQNSIAAAFVDNFHGEGLSVRPDAATIKSDLAKLMADLISTQDGQNNEASQASNQEVLVGACSAALASAQMVFY